MDSAKTVTVLLGLILVALLTLVILAVLLRPTTPRRSLVDEHELEPSDDVEGEARVLPIEDSIDLHGFAPRDIPSVVESYLEAAIERGFDEVRLIHGRGKGVQRARVREVLRTHPGVAEFRDAPGHRGGYGATLVWLKR